MTDEPRQDEPVETDDARDADSEAGDAQPQADEQPSAKVVFSPERFRNELAVDLFLRRGLGVLAVVAILCAVVFDMGESMVGLALVMLLVFGWIAINSVSANVWRALPLITVTIGRDAVGAEEGLAQLIKRRPLIRWVRVLLYHRLAAIRHRQHRFAESAAICRAVLPELTGPARKQEGSLLLMLAEASLQCRDLYGAWDALSRLNGIRLGLAERLQRLTIQTRYEVLCGHDRAALHNIQKKLLLAELMPAEHCGAMHAMLTTSAQRAGRDELAHWLWRRSQLLCGAEKLERLVKSAYAIGVVGPPEG